MDWSLVAVNLLGIVAVHAEEPDGRVPHVSPGSGDESLSAEPAPDVGAGPVEDQLRPDAGRVAQRKLHLHRIGEENGSVYRTHPT